MSEQEPVLMMNIEGTLYPVAMTQDQLTMIKLFVAEVSQDQAFSVLKKVPVAEASDVALKIHKSYGLRVVE